MSAASPPSRRTTRTITRFLDHALRPLYYEFVQSRAQTRGEATTMFDLRMASIGAALVILTSTAIAEPLQRSGKARKTISPQLPAPLRTTATTYYMLRAQTARSIRSWKFPEASRSFHGNSWTTNKRSPLATP